jgi:hypothetical protein
MSAHAIMIRRAMRLSGIPFSFVLTDFPAALFMVAL